MSSDKVIAKHECAFVARSALFLAQHMCVIGVPELLVLRREDSLKSINARANRGRHKELSDETFCTS